MAEPAPPPEGATTVPPPPPGAEPAVGAASFPSVVVLPPKPQPVAVPLRPPRGPRRPLSWWLRQAVPLLGLALFVGCLYGLLDKIPLPGQLPGRPEDGSPSRITGNFGHGVVAVVIDPGHGGIDSGAMALGLQEKALTLDVALRVAQALEGQGIHVRMTRTSDQAVSLEDRVRIANGTPGAIFVSIHFNDALSTDHGQSYHASGVETYYSEHKQFGGAGDWLWTSLFGGRSAGPASQRDSLAWAAREGALLADAIQGSLVLATAAADRGTKERALYVTRRVRGPAVLVEGGFISHPTEAKHLGEPAYRQKLAEAIASGIVKYLQTTGRPGASGSGRDTPAGA